MRVFKARIPYMPHSPPQLPTAWSSFPPSFPPSPFRRALLFSERYGSARRSRTLVSTTQLDVEALDAVGESGAGGWGTGCVEEFFLNKATDGLFMLRSQPSVVLVGLFS